MSAPPRPADKARAAASAQGHTRPGAVPEEGEWQRALRPVVDLCRTPGGARDRQVLYGQRVQVIAERAGWSQVRLGRDGYEGYLETAALGPDGLGTHRVAVPATHAYPRPDLKQREVFWLSFGSELRVVSAASGPGGAFFETDTGLFVPKPHLRPLNAPFADPVTVAQLHFGTPYLWGGNSAAGIDCSGLVQAALLAAAIPCPGDSAEQWAGLGVPVEDSLPVARGDLFFWRGHVALAVDAEVLIHANGHSMAVSYEPIAAALERIAPEAPWLGRRRLRAG